MADSERLVVDTYVAISAMFFPDSIPGRALRKAQQQTILASEATLIELLDVVRRPRWERYIQQGLREQLLSVFISACRTVPVFSTVRECRDPRDNKFLELAVDGRATVIISGDADLLVLHPFRGILILTPAQYLNNHPA